MLFYLTGCGTGSGVLTGSGSFQSPNYPNNYPSNQNCTWTLASSSSQQVRVLLIFVPASRHLSVGETVFMGQ